MGLYRTIVLIFSIFVPIYIWYTFTTFVFDLSWLPYNWAQSQTVDVSVRWVTPIVFSIAWLYFMILLGSRISESLDQMGQTSALISKQYVIFYGVITVVLLFLFLIPIVTPIIAFLAYSSMIFKALTSKVDFNDLDAPTQKFVKRASLLGIIPGLYCSILIVPDLIKVSIGLFIQFWGIFVNPLFLLIKALGIALSVGSLIMLFRRGVAEYDKGKSAVVKPSIEMYFIEGLIVFFILLMNYYKIEFVELLYYLGGGIVVFTSGLEAWKGRNEEGGFVHNSISRVLYVVFFLSTYFYEQYPVLQYALVIGSSLIFGIAFLFVFAGYGESEGSE